MLRCWEGGEMFDVRCKMLDVKSGKRWGRVKPVVALLVGAMAWGCAREAAREQVIDAGAVVEPVAAAPKMVMRESVTESATGSDKALAQEWRDLAKAYGNMTAARELMNHSRERGNQVNVSRLAGEVPATPGEMSWARRYVQEQVGQLSQLSDWPAAKSYTIKKARGAITGDVMDDEALWAPAERIVINIPVREHLPISGGAVCRMLWDEGALHVLYEVKDSEINSAARTHDDPVWKGDCVELFVLGDFATGKYWELNINPEGVVYDAMNTKHMNGWGGVIDTKANATAMRVYTKRTGAGYRVQMSLPWGLAPGFEAGGRAQKGRVVWMLAGWVNSTKEGKELRTIYYSHAPVLGWFHNIWGYTRFELE
jgi:hypothetical protein